MEIVGGKWTILILLQLNTRVLRYGELKKRIPGISEKVLIDQLNTLIKNNFVEKKSYPEIPPKVEYQLSPLGRKFLPVIDEMVKFGLEYL